MLSIDDRGKTPERRSPAALGSGAPKVVFDAVGSSEVRIRRPPGKGKPRSAALLRKNPHTILKSPMANANPGSYTAKLRRELAAPDDRCVIAAFDLVDEENKAAPVIAAVPGFAVLLLHYSAKRRVIGFSANPVIAWRLCHDGESPFPLTFNGGVKYHAMHDCAVRNPDGSVITFEGFAFPSAADWLTDRRHVLRDVS